MFSKDKNSKMFVQAFSLTELLIVMVIIGILVLIALPNLMPLITRAKSTEAKLQLSHVYTLERTHFFEFSKYSDNLDQIGFEQEKLVADGGQANYLIEIVEASADGFIVQATSTVDFDRDGIFNVWQIDQDKNLTEITKD
jgi:type IV pilus assembly protein PilE